LNIKGEKFNIVRTGDAPLVSIASDGTAHLEVMARIEGVKKCQKKMFITRVNSSGSWLEKNVAVTVGSQDENQAFNVMVDGQEVWSPASRGYTPPTAEKVVFNHANKFSINEMASKAAQQPGMQLKMSPGITMKIVRPLRRPTTPPHLNFDIQGLANLPGSFKVGGLLGQDDHSYWSAREDDCSQTSARDFARTKEDVGSIASAH